MGSDVEMYTGFDTVLSRIKPYKAFTPTALTEFKPMQLFRILVSVHQRQPDRSSFDCTARNRKYIHFCIALGITGFLEQFHIN